MGTSCMVPTKQRNVSGLFLQWKDEGVLFDCGEGTQRQMNIAGIKRTSVTRILISHWHGDHVSGLIGLIQTLGHEENAPKLHVYGPKETKMRLGHLFHTCIFGNNVDITVHEIDIKKLGKIEDQEEFEIWAAPMDHDIPCVGYSFVEKDRHNIDKDKMKELGLKPGPHMADLKDGKAITIGKKKIHPKDIITVIKGRRFTVIPDTAECKGAFDLCEDADMVVCEATYGHDEEEKARKHFHMTSRQAAQLASQTNAKQLFLTHFSQRYSDMSKVEDDAKMIFPNTVCAQDFMKVKISVRQD